MVKRDPLIVRPFGSIGARYRVTRRGRLLHRVRVGFSAALIVAMLVLLGVFPLYPTMLFVLMGFFVVREFLMAKIMMEATPLDD